MSNPNIKTLLVIGNGFDLAHELKTKYIDFLDFINGKRRIHIKTYIDEKMVKRDNLENNSDNPHLLPHLLSVIDENKKFRENLQNMYRREVSNNNKNIKFINEKHFTIQQKLSNNELKLEDILDYILNFGNIWIDYFNEIVSRKIRSIGENWVDFEKEIENSIQNIEKIILGEKIDDEDLHYIINDYDRIPIKIIVQECIPRLSWDLEILTLAFEFYLIEVTNNIQHKHLTIIDNLSEVSAIISYNYSNIWKQVYDPKETVKPYFIHGELGKHNLILGIGETLSENLENQITECASFKKFFQRVKHRLGNEYRRIANMDFGKHYKWQIIIYGHSLDPTDKDSLLWLLSKSTRFQTPVDSINIYYYDEKAYNQQIANAIQIIGKNTLIDDVNSERIIFKPIINYK